MNITEDPVDLAYGRGEEAYKRGAGFEPGHVARGSRTVSSGDESHSRSAGAASDLDVQTGLRAHRVCKFLLLSSVTCLCITYQHVLCITRLCITCLV